jgi:hypothetical protein
MPLLDHFRPPIKNRLPWESLHSGWIAGLAERLNALMPPDFVALDRMRIDGGLEIDIGAVEEHEAESSPGVNGTIGGSNTVATLPAIYTPPPATGTAPFNFPDIVEVRVYRDRDERKLVGAIELVSPGNKDRTEKREAFVAKCLDYLNAGASLVIVDVVTERHAILHNDIVRLLPVQSTVVLPEESHLYAAAYRPVIRENRAEIDIWVNSFAVGDPLPTMPLRLIADYFVPVELEATYMEACRRRRLIP